MCNKIKIKSITPVAGEEVIANDRTFRRYTEHAWQELIGGSWEEVWRCEDLEQAYQQYRADHA